MSDKITPLRTLGEVAKDFYDYIEKLDENEKAMLGRLLPELHTETMKKLATIYAGYAFDSDFNHRNDRQWGKEEQGRDMDMVEALLHKTHQCILEAFQRQPKPLGIDLSRVREIQPSDFRLQNPA